MLARSTPIDPRLQMIDMQPLIQAAQVREKARADLNKSVVDAIDDFNKKKKKQMEEKISIKNIQELLGVDNPALAKDLLKNPIVLEAYKYQQQADARANEEALKAQELENAKNAAIEQERRIQLDKSNRQAAIDAVAVNTDTEGNIDFKSAARDFVSSFGGTDQKYLQQILGRGKITRTKDNTIVDEFGNYLGTASSTLIPKTKEEIKAQQLANEKKEKEIEELSLKIQALQNEINLGKQFGTSSGTKTVQLKDRSGNLRNVPEDQVEEALGAGYTRP